MSGCCFIRNTFAGFCVFESMASILPFVDEYVILDLSSTDGTLHYLERIAEANPKVKLVHGTFPVIDAGAFATLADDVIGMCSHPNVIYHQADEIWHEDLLKLMERKLQEGKFDLSFWRYQLRENFQRSKWPGHVVHRVGNRDNGSFKFVADGMRTERNFDAELCSNYDGGYYMRWGDMAKEFDEGRGPGVGSYVHEMILDVSLVGGFRDNIPDRRRLHSPFWHETDSIEGVPPEQWIVREKSNPNWTKTESPYNLPKVMRWHVGKTTYQLRRELFEALCADDTRSLIGL